MYTPASNAEHRLDVLHAFMRTHALGTLVTMTDRGLFATHLPFVLDASRGSYGRLEGHVARANPHHRLDPAGEALILFQGPDAYITPSWYPSKAVDGRVVPTWNYVAVHAYGIVRFRDDEAFLRAHLATLTAQHEAERKPRWSITDAPSGYIDTLVQAIVGVEIEITRIEGKWKMSQNRSAADIDGVITGLGASASARERAVGQIVAAVRPPRSPE
ncbi:MAG: FMN-binding negative transcriptional regulator [Gemmatimonadaceae bacterium]